MKKILIILTILAFAAAAFAQPGSASTDRKLQNSIRKVEGRIKSLERLLPLPKPVGENRLKRAIDSANSDLDSLKTAHPQYDATALENRIIDLIRELSSAQKEGQEDSATQDDFVDKVNEILGFRPETRDFISNSPGIATRTDEKLAAFRAEMKAQITESYQESSKKGSPRVLKNIGAKVSRAAETEMTMLKGFSVASVKKMTSENKALSNYYNLVFAKTRFETLALLFDDISEVKNVTKTAENLLAELGTKEEISSLTRKNYAVLVASRRMSPEIKNNPSLKAEFIRVFKSNLPSTGPKKGGKVLRVHLLSSDWRVERNKLTGIILHRYQYAQFAVKAADDRCFLYTFSMQQNNKGGSYGRGYMVSNIEVEMLCSNVPK